MKWTTVNSELAITDRQRSGYDYRIRRVDDGALLIAEGRISDGGPTRREKCASFEDAMGLAEQWENSSE